MLPKAYLYVKMVMGIIKSIDLDLRGKKPNSRIETKKLTVKQDLKTKHTRRQYNEA